MFWPNLSTIPLANSLARTRYFHRSRTIPNRQPPCNHLNFEGKIVKQYASGQLCAQEPQRYRMVPDMFNFLIYRYTYIYILLRRLVHLGHNRKTYGKSNITIKGLLATSLILSFLKFLVLQNKSPNENPKLPFYKATTEKFLTIKTGEKLQPNRNS